ncbi:MAG: hypothetical protein Q9199_004760, partial [Rusavskia elegans]
RKAESSVDVEEAGNKVEKPPSKRELKRRAAKARKAVATEKADGSDNAVKDSTEKKENGDVAMANSKDQG